MKIFPKIHALYKDERIIVQEKAVTLFILSLLLPVIFSILGILRLRTNMVMGIGEFLIALLIVGGAVLILKRKYYIVSYALMIIFWVAATGLFGISFLKDVASRSVNSVFQLAAYQLAAIVTTPLLAYRTRQVILMLIFTLVASLGYYFLLINPALSAAGFENILSTYLLSLTLVVAAGAFSFEVFRNQKISFVLLEEQAEKEGKRFERMNEILNSTAKAFDVGEELVTTAEESLQIAESISRHLDTVNRNISTLAAGMDDSEQRNNQMHEASGTVKKSIDTQSDAIDQSSTAVEQISAQIHNISGNADEKRVLIENLVELSQQGVDSIEDALQQYNEISRSAENILEVIQVIEGISSRTNLLAMNAAIEAAHAGDAGKGFAVVADEIRKLAEETQENSRVIRETLEESNNRIHDTTESSAVLKEVFTSISDSVKQVNEAIMEIISGMAELTEGTRDITDSVGHLRNSGADVHQSMETMEQSLQATAEQSRSIRDISSQVEAAVQELSSLVMQSLQQSNRITEIGQRNKQNFSSLETEIASIRVEGSRDQS